MSITIEFIRNEIEKQSYELSLHADNERLNDELTISEIEFALNNGEIIENYGADTRGASCLVYGTTENAVPVHIVCGKNKQNHLFIITVYIPSLPKWQTPHVRNK
ncbi:MAG: DUF4258 domain-containing protein [Desulfamplus sp.]|nr:DUF4258 domain-containing protein [Desulfamplus sp.]